MLALLDLNYDVLDYLILLVYELDVYYLPVLPWLHTCHKLYDIGRPHLLREPTLRTPSTVSRS